MKHLPWILATALFLAAPLSQAADTTADTPASGTENAASQAAPSKHEIQALKWFHQLDSNGDGCVTKSEAAPVFLIKPSLRKWFDETDTNHDGCLTEEEVRVRAAKDKAKREARRAREAAEKARAAQPAKQ